MATVLSCFGAKFDLIEPLDDVLKPSSLQLLPDPVGHVETGRLEGLGEDGSQ